MKKGFYPYPYIWGAVAAALLVLGFVTAASADEPPAGTPLTMDNTAGVIVLGINEDPRGFLFVSKTGAVAYETLEHCAERPACGKLIEALKAAGRLDILRLSANKGIES